MGFKIVMALITGFLLNEPLKSLNKSTSLEDYVCHLSVCKLSCVESVLINDWLKVYEIMFIWNFLSYLTIIIMRWSNHANYMCLKDLNLGGINLPFILSQFSKISHSCFQIVSDWLLGGNSLKQDHSKHGRCCQRAARY